VTTGKGRAIEISYSGARSLDTFSGISYCNNGERVFMFDFDTKEREHQNTRQSDLYSGTTPPHSYQIASCFDALSITNFIDNVKVRINAGARYIIYILF
jgi:hypothetical protein